MKERTEKFSHTKKINTMYVYQKTDVDPNVFTVGYYNIHQYWIPEKDCKTAEEAAERVAWLNGAAFTRNEIEGIKQLLKLIAKNLPDPTGEVAKLVQQNELQFLSQDSPATKQVVDTIEKLKAFNRAYDANIKKEKK